MLVVLAAGKSILWQQNYSDGRKVFEMGAVKGPVYYKEQAFNISTNRLSLTFHKATYSSNP